MTGRIDTHTHIVPPAYRDWLRSQPNFPGPFVDWDRDAALAFFDSSGIAAGILSLSSPGVRLPGSTDVAQARDLARMVNEYSAEVVRSAPDRFGFFATLTLPDVDGAIEEAQYAIDELGADGVVLMTNTDGTYLGSPEVAALLHFLNDRSAVVFVHPTVPAGARAAGLSPGVVDFNADTVRCAVSLATSGALTENANLKVILSHGGGFLPYTAMRIANMVFPGRDPREAVDEFRRFYFDVALSTSHYSMPSLLSFARPGHLTFGTDWPYSTTEQASSFTAQLDALSLEPGLNDAINRDNATELFPRLAAFRDKRSEGTIT